jgi:hypothetical protein
MPNVNIDGVGVVNFPDSMSQQDIQDTIEKEILPSHGNAQSKAEDTNMSPFMSGVTSFNTGVERTAQGILQPLTESGILGDHVKTASKQVAKQRETDYQSAAQSHPTISTIGSALGSIASTAPFAAIPGLGEGAIARGLSQAAIGGGLAGGSQYVDDGGSRLFNTALGVGAAVPTFGVMKGLLSANPFVKAGTAAAVGTAGGLAYGGGDYKKGAEGAALAVPLAFAPGLAGNAIRNGISKLAGKPSSTTSPIDNAVAMKMLTGVDEDTALANQAAAQRLDPRFNLTPAEASGSPLAAAQQGRLGKSPEGAQQLIARGQDRIGVQKDIINNFMNDISPDSTPANEDIRSISQKILNDRHQALQQKAQPHYDKAMQQEIGPDQFQALMQNPKIANTLESVMKDPVFADEISGYSPNSVKVLDEVKKRLDSEIGSHMPTIASKGDLNRVRLLTNIKNNLVSTLDDVSPDYKMARQIYSDEAPGVQQLRNSKIAKFANLTDDQLKSIHRDIFDPGQMDTTQLAKYRDEISSVDPDAWNRLVRSHLVSTLNNEDANGSIFYNKLLKGDNQFNQLNEALKNVPGAAQKLRDMRLTFKNLVNPVTVKTAAGQSKASTFTPDNRNFKDSAMTAIHNLLGGHYDRAGVDFVTSGNWDKGFQTIRNIADKDKRAQAMAQFLGNIAANRASNLTQGK